MLSSRYILLFFCLINKIFEQLVLIIRKKNKRVCGVALNEKKQKVLYKKSLEGKNT